MKNTVFILGAGASSPYGFPLGHGLVDKLIYKLNPEPTDNQKALKCISEAGGWVQGPRPLESFRKMLQTAKESSIDSFLKFHSGCMEEGKLALAYILLGEEKDQFLFNPKKKEEDWYPYIRDLLSAPFGEFHNNRTSFITFNYDRSLEHFLFTTLSSRERLIATPEQWAKKLRECVPIVHLHGELGKHPAFACPEELEGKTIPYGSNPTPALVHIASKSIRNVHDEVDLDSDPAFQEAYRLISQAEFIFFLGFAYDERNVRKLRLGQCLRGEAKIFGTGLGLTEAERARVQRISDNKIMAEHIIPMECVQFLRQSHAIQAVYERR